MIRPEDIIQEVKVQAGEWLEMSDNPHEIVAGILAHKIVKLTEYVEYLERVVKNAKHTSYN